MMYENSQQTFLNETEFPLMSSAAASRAKMFQAQMRYGEKSSGSKGKGPVYGQSSSDLFLKFDQGSSSWKMSGNFSEMVCSASWAILPASGSMQNGELFQESASAHCNVEKGYGWLPTLPKTENKDFSKALILAKLDKGGRVARRICKWSSLRHSEEQVGLNPSFAEAITGLPIGWTELDHVETP